MAERLIMDIQLNNEVIAQLYYPWGAYTIDTYQHLEKITKAVQEAGLNSPNMDRKTALLQILDQTMGFAIDSVGELNKTYPDLTWSNELNNIDGLACYSESDKEKWCQDIQGTAMIDFETGEYNNLNFDTRYEGTDQDAVYEARIEKMLANILESNAAFDKTKNLSKDLSKNLSKNTIEPELG